LINFNIEKKFLPGGVEEVGDLIEAKGEVDDLMGVRGEIDDLETGGCILRGKVGGDRGRKSAAETGEQGCLPCTTKSLEVALTLTSKGDNMNIRRHTSRPIVRGNMNMR
jgi:hypothetical protein